MRTSDILATAVIFLLAFGLRQGTAQAQQTAAGENFGLGIMVGEPTGVSVKSWNNTRSAFDIGAAWSLSNRFEALHMHADYLLHSWFDDPENLAFYYGLGGRVIFTSDAHAGIRVPVGLNVVFGEVPLDLFVEAVPVLDLTPEVELAGNGAVGIRYYF